MIVFFNDVFAGLAGAVSALGSALASALASTEGYSGPKF
jgi:hypothetical protein